MSIYLDNAATTPLCAEAKEAMIAALELFGNPSSTHAEGRKAKALVERVRKEIAAALNCLPAEVIFTSGGTEADNWALQSSVEVLGVNKLYHSELEHHAVTHMVEALAPKLECVAIPFNEHGDHDLDWLEAALAADAAAGRKALVSLMHANNEIGNLADLDCLSAMTRAHGALLHSDTVQTMAHLKLDFGATPLEFAACSAHKFHGPKGVGFAYIKQGTGVQPFIRGGAQERGHRAGTENVVGIAGLGAAFSAAMTHLDADAAHMTRVKSHAIDALRAAFPSVRFNGRSGDLDKSLFTVLNFYVPELHEGGMLNFQLDLQGFCVSGGSACSSGAVGGSHVLGGLKSPGGTRISFSRMTTTDEIDAFVHALQNLPKLD
ncbi:MAG: cysteine desulfurase family protein [Schleiferiaceae bacterium]